MTGNEWFAFAIWPLVALAMRGGWPKHRHADRQPWPRSRDRHQAEHRSARSTPGAPGCVASPWEGRDANAGGGLSVGCVTLRGAAGSIW